MNPPAQLPVLSANTLPLRPALAILTALAAIALLLTACGGKEPDFPPYGDSSPAGSAPQVSAASSQPTAATAVPAAPAARSAAESSTNDPVPADPVKVMTGNVVLADLVRQVGGDLVRVDALVAAGADVHTWQSIPADSVRIAEADLVVSNGAGLAAQVEDLLDNNSSADAVRVIASEGLELQELVELPFPGGDHHDHEEYELELAGRLLIGDGETGALSVIDPETGHVHQNQFDLGVSFACGVPIQGLRVADK